MKAADAALEGDPFALGFDGGVHLPAGLFHHLLNVGGVDAPVGNQFLQGQTGDLPADGLEAGDGDGFRRVVNDEVYTRQGLNGTDIPAFPADDPALHFVIGQGNHTDGHIGHLVGGAALDGLGHDLPGPGVALLFHPGLHLFDFEGGLVSDFRFYLVDEVLLRLLGGEAGDALQHFGLAALDKFDLFGLLVDGGVLLSQGLLFLFHGLNLPVEVFLLLLQAVLLPLKVGAAFLDFLFVLAAVF